MKLLLQECERDSTCHQAFPQIRDDWTTVLAQLERGGSFTIALRPDKAAKTVALT